MIDPNIPRCYFIGYLISPPFDLDLGEKYQCRLAPDMSILEPLAQREKLHEE